MFDRRADCGNFLLGGEDVWAKGCNLGIPLHFDLKQHLAGIGRARCNQIIVSDFQLSALGRDNRVQMDCETRG